MLRSEVDGYAMALAALLLRPREFTLGSDGMLMMDAGIQTSCEDRRLAIRSLAGRLLTSLDGPLREKEAVRFMAAETNEERKMIVHHLESAVRHEWEESYSKASHDPNASSIWLKAIDTLTTERPPTRFRSSSWDLDRIYYYLLGRLLPRCHPGMVTPG